MYFKLALGNVRKSARDYAIYFVTLALGVAVFYAFNTISEQATSFEGASFTYLENVKPILRGMTIFLAVIMGFLMVYANNYLLRRRKRELGLYQLLGMRRVQVSGILTLETMLVSVGSFVVGLAVGVLFSQLMIFVTAAVFHAKVSGFGFRFSVDAAIFTLCCYAVIFLVMLVRNLVTLGRVRLSEMMGAEHENEQVAVRSLPATVVLGLAGIVLIVVSYLRLASHGMSYDLNFLITTVMMVAGTFSFFYAFSGILLHVGQLMRGHYYSKLNMFTLRQLSARINTLSVSMAVVALVLFLAITSVGTGMGIATALNRGDEMAAPYDASIIAGYAYNDSLNNIVQIGQEVELDHVQTGLSSSDTLPVANILQGLKDKGIDLSKIASETASYTLYDYRTVEGADRLGYENLSQQTGIELPAALKKDVNGGEGTSGHSDLYYGSFVDASGSFVYLASASDYNAARKLLGMSPVNLDGKYLFTSNYTGDTQNFYKSVMEKGCKLTVGGTVLSPAAEGFDASGCAAVHNAKSTKPRIVMVVPDELLAGARPLQTCLNMKYATSVEDGDAFAAKNFPQSSDASTWTLLEGEPDGPCAAAYLSITRNEATGTNSSSAGLVAYLSIYIGFVLVIACAAIMAIQQLSAASDSAPSYLLLSELGAPAGMAMGSLLRQVLAFFAAPLIVGVAHASMALSQTLKTASYLAGSDLTMAAIAIVSVFVAIYAVYFVVTYVMARGVVSAKAKR